MLINTDTLKTVVNGLLMKINSKAVQSDWNQNNSTADSYIKNRTHWEESKERKLIRDIDFSNCYMVDWGQTKIGYLYEFIPISLKIGKKYNVVFDGTLYQCVAFRDNEFSNVVIGNGLFVADSNSDNGLPFAIGNYSNSYSDAYVIVADQETHSFSITDTEIIIHKLDYKYLDLPTNLATTDDVQEATNNKMDANNPVGAGSFSMNRKSGTIVGNYSHAEGYNTTASGSYSHAEGKYNISDTENKYAHIVGNGTSSTKRSNAHTLDWNGVGWFKGGLQVGGNAQDNGAKNVLLEGDALKIEDIKISLPVSTTWSSVTHGNGKFVAIAGGYSTTTNIAAYSTDGISWSQTTLPISANWYAVTYGNDKFVAIGGTNICAYSNDGITWTQIDFPETNSTASATHTWRTIAYGNGKFIVSSTGGGAIAYSEDGITWTKASGSTFDSITYGNGKFVAFGRGETFYSTDGINWTSSSKLSSELYSLYRVNYSRWDVTYGNGKFVAAGTDNSTNSNDVTAYSEDGVTWTGVMQSTTSVFKNSGSNKLLANDGAGKFVALVNYGTDFAAYSEDGVNWLETKLPVKAVWSSVTYGKGKFVAISQGTKFNISSNNDIVIESTDGINWRNSYDVITQNNKDRADDLKSLILGDIIANKADKTDIIGLATEDFVREFMQSDEFKTLIRAEAEAIILGGAW